MRSYFVSFSFLAALVAGYTAVVLTSQSPSSSPAKTESPRASADLDHREPATSAQSDVRAD